MNETVENGWERKMVGEREEEGRDREGTHVGKGKKK